MSDYECEPANTLREDTKETFNNFSMHLNKELDSLHDKFKQLDAVNEAFKNDVSWF